MNETTARAMIKDHFDASDIGSAGGGPGDDIVRERIYFGEPWEPPAWWAQWVERMEPEAPHPPA
jgi:hypothetical protein